MISDKLIRESIRNENSRSVVVEASAGTGKTTLLTDRVKALVDSGIPLEQLAVVTFTEAAASELRMRIREKLTTKQRRTMDQAWITTIHGFASKILREFFHLCKGAPDFSMEATHFSESELEIFWDLFLSDANPDVLRESADSLKKAGTGKLLEIAGEIENHRWFLNSKPLGNTVLRLEETKDFWKNEIDLILLQCTNSSDKLLTNIQKTVDSFNIKDQLPVKINLRSGSAGNWGGKESLADIKLTLKTYNSTGLKDITGYSNMIPLLPAVDKLVIPFVNHLRAIWDKDPTRLSFNDLLYKAFTAVTGSPQLRAELNAKFSHIFIDEFQDTSLVQVKLFRNLLQKSGMEKKLTVVGDPKQSIFGWRSADIETYKDTLSKLEEGNALSETIVVNFRSEISIINFVNSFGSQLFKEVPEDEIPFSCDYSPIEPRPGAVQGEGVTVHRLPDVKAGQMAVIQAKAIVDLITDPASTAILFRTKTHLDELIQELDKQKVPYRVEASRDFHTRREVEDTAWLLRALLNPSDKFALIKTLRSIFFGINDREITIWNSGSKSDTIQKALDFINQLREVRVSLPPGPFVETLFINSCILTVVKESGYQVTRRLGNLRFILETAHDASDYALLLETLTGLAPMSAEEPSAPPENHTGVVTLTTIHRAKGLAWKHVILANPGNSFRNTVSSVLTNPRKLSAGIKLAGGFTANYPDLTVRTKSRSHAEFRRLLYVAVTRPRQKLDIFIPEKIKNNSPAEILNNALNNSNGFFTDTPVIFDDSQNSNEAKSSTINNISITSEFQLLYPENLPTVQINQNKYMQLGTEAHSILEFINFKQPKLWLENNKKQLYNTLEFPHEAITLAMKFFDIYNLNDVEILGKEYALLVEGKQYYIDLLLRRNNVIEIIDYKTDREDPVIATENYREKQLMYASTIRNLYKGKVEAKLVFLHHGIIVNV